MFSNDIEMSLKPTEYKFSFISRPSPKAGRELQTELDRMMRDDVGTHSEKSAGAGHRAVSLHRDCVLVL